jgi:RsiW-degrading membrane proteinase PrsW (M82 family)
MLRTIAVGRYRISLGALLFCAGVTFWIGNMLLRTGGAGFSALTSSLYFVFLLVLVTSGTRTITIARLTGFYCLGGAMMSAMWLVAMEFTALEGTRYIGREVFVPFMEETLKLAPVAFFLWRQRNSRLWTLGASDVLLMAAASGAGFALVEDAYLRLHGASWTTPIDWLPVASISGDHLVAGHGIWTGLAGATLGLALLWRRLGKARYALAASGWLWSVLDHISNNYAAGLSMRHDDPLHDFLLTVGGHGYFAVEFFFAALAVAIVADFYVIYATLPLGFLPPAPFRFTVEALPTWWTATLERRKFAYLVFRTRATVGRRRAQLLINGALMHQMLIGAAVRI